MVAIEIPLNLRWVSANCFSYAPQQATKELAYSDFYRLSLGVDSLRYHEFGVDIEIRSRANFLQTYMEVHKARLSYHGSKFNFGGLIKPSGYARGFQLHPTVDINPDMDEYLFLPNRFNGIFVEYPSRIDVNLEIGGNLNSQAIGRVSEDIPVLRNNGSVTLVQEIQTFDTHWHQPVFIGAAHFYYHASGLEISSTAAGAYYPDYKERAASFSPFFHFEANNSIGPNYSLYLQGIYKELNPNGTSHTSLDTALGKKLGKCIISAGSRLDYLKDDSQIIPYINLRWIPVLKQHLGVYYRYLISGENSNLHQAGLTAELNFGF